MILSILIQLYNYQIHEFNCSVINIELLSRLANYSLTYFTPFYFTNAVIS